MYAYSNAVMEPWDGPAALAMTDGRWVCAGLDRNGLRPMRYVVTGDGLVIAGSEAGMVPVDEMNVVEKGALGPGQMLAVDMVAGALYHDAELKDLLAASQPFGDWVGLDHRSRGGDGGGRGAAAVRGRGAAAAPDRGRLHARGARGDPRTPWPRTARRRSARWATTRRPAVLSDRYRPLSHYFRQNFSQVTNPPIDSLREHRVMSLKTRFGNLKNVLDQDNSQTEILQLESPFVSNAGFEAMLAGVRRCDVVTIDCTFAPGEAEALRDGLERVRTEAEEAVRAGRTTSC
jgi:glutamate synthase (NADPH) large chain